MTQILGAGSSSKTLLTMYQLEQCHIQDNLKLHKHHYENLKFGMCQ